MLESRFQSMNQLLLKTNPRWEVGEMIRLKAGQPNSVVQIEVSSDVWEAEGTQEMHMGLPDVI